MTLEDVLNQPQFADMVTALDYAGLETALSLQNIPVISPGSFLTELGVLNLLGLTNGDTFLTALENASNQSTLLARAVRWLRSNTGVDVGNAQVQIMLAQMATDNIISSDSVNLIIAFGTKQISIADQLEMGPIGRGLLMQTIADMRA